MARSSHGAAIIAACWSLRVERNSDREKGRNKRRRRVMAEGHMQACEEDPFSF